MVTLAPPPSHYQAPLLFTSCSSPKHPQAVPQYEIHFTFLNIAMHRRLLFKWAVVRVTILKKEFSHITTIPENIISEVFITIPFATNQLSRIPKKWKATPSNSFAGSTPIELPATWVNRTQKALIIYLINLPLGTCVIHKVWRESWLHSNWTAARLGKDD